MYRKNVRVWAVGATEPYILEESADIREWTPFRQALQPTDFVAYLPETSGPIRFFRARLLRVAFANASAPTLRP